MFMIFVEIIINLLLWIKSLSSVESYSELVILFEPAISSQWHENLHEGKEKSDHAEPDIDCQHVSCVKREVAVEDARENCEYQEELSGIRVLISICAPSQV